MKPVLFILDMPFEDPAEGEGKWICTHCVLIEGALAHNPHWREKIDVKHIPFPRPRAEVIALMGEENQWLPALVLEPGKAITDTTEILEYLVKEFGGTRPHP